MRRIVIVVAGLAVTAAVAAGIAVGASRGDSEEPIQGPALARASPAALESTGGGRVTDTEVGDEQGAFEVEVTLEDGSQVDVHLAADFSVLGSEGDSDESADED
jgi:hypothetical protein